jgi:putative phosphoribosyl transferase
MTSSEHAVSICSREITLEGDLSVPRYAKGIVIFAHGSGSSRYSPRNRYVARTLQDSGLATLLFDLLTIQEEDEERWTRHLRFNIPLLADRLVSTTAWIKNNTETRNLNIGYFGASTGAAAALVAAANRPNVVEAVVSRGGRPDLAGTNLEFVKAPTLLVVGENDQTVIELNRTALMKLNKVKNKKIIIIPRATHLFEEPGTLEQVASIACNWFLNYLRK